MADQFGECSVPLENAFSLTVVKEEECQDEDFIDDKVQISETAIITEVQDIMHDKIKQYDISTISDNIKTELEFSKVQCDMKHGNIKIEEGISADNIRIEFNNRLLYCEDCQVYREDYCVECEMLMHILNKIVPINADNRTPEQLPNGILEVQYYFGKYRILALKVIPFGVRFGPFTGLNAAEHSWNVKGGKFVIDKDKSKYLNWMQYISPARNIYEQNLRVFQYERNLYYESTRQIQVGDELLVYFGEEYEDSLNRNVEMDFIPTTEHSFKNAFVCTFCCLGFSSKSYLAKHKAICLENAAGAFTIEDVMQCPSCKIYMDQKEYLMHHMAYCCEGNDRKRILPTSDNRRSQATERRTRQQQIYKCQQCKYRTKYKGDLKNHTNKHNEVKRNICGVCCKIFKTKEVLRLHVESAHVYAGGKEDNVEYSIGVYIKAEQSWTQDDAKQFKCSICEFRTKYTKSLKRHMVVRHLKEFQYKCDSCSYKTNVKCNLKTHIEGKHLKEFQYKCDTCEYKTNLKSSLKTHIKTIHRKEFKYKCDTCDYKTNVKCNLKSHIEGKHLNEFKYKCDTCDYITHFKSSLKRHINTIHWKEFKYKCDACDYKTNRKYNLRAHIETKHLNEFKHKCDACDYKATRRSQLKNHIQTKHLKEFKYKCDRCDYKTNLKGNLKKHTGTRHLK